MYKKPALFLLLTLSFYFADAQTYHPDKNGYIADPKFHQLIKSRGYELVGAFDTLQLNPLLIFARFQKNGKWGIIDNHGKVIQEAESVTDITSKEIKGDPGEPGIASPRYPLNPNKNKNQYSVFHNGMKYGIKDAFGNETTPGTYDYILLVNDSIAIVKSGKLYGANFPSGKIILPVEYDLLSVSGVPSSYFLVKKDGHYGITSLQGKEIIPATFDRIISFMRPRDLLHVTQGGKQALFSITGKQLTPFIYNQINEFGNTGLGTFSSGDAPNMKMGVIDTLGQQRIPAEFDQVSFLTSPKLIRVSVGKYPDQQTWLLDMSGKAITQKDYSDIGGFSNGFARVVRGKSPDGRYGFIDTTGNEVIKTKYESADYFNKKGVAVIRTNKKFGLINLRDEPVVPPVYDMMETFQARSVYAIVQEKKFGLVDMQGNIFVKPSYDLIRQAVPYGYQVTLNGKQGLIDNDGKLVVPAKYTKIESTNYKTIDRGLLSAEVDGRKCKIDRYGNEYFGRAEANQNFVPDEDGYVNTPAFQQFIKEKGFQLVGSFDTLERKPVKLAARVMVDGNWKVMDTKGKLFTYSDRTMGIIPNSTVNVPRGSMYDISIDVPVSAQQELPGNMSVDKTSVSNYETVSLNGKYGTMDNAHQKVGLPAIYDMIQSMGSDLVMIRLQGKYGMAHSDGKIVIEPKYDQITPDTHRGKFDFDRFFILTGGKYGLISGTGQEIIAPKYDRLVSAEGFDKSNQLLRFYVDKKCGLMRKDGKILMNPTYDDLNSVYNGLIKTVMGTTYPRNYGLVDTTGKVLLEPVYKSLEYSYYKKIISVTVAGDRGDKYGYADLHGKIIIKPVYDQVNDFDNGAALVKLNGKYGLIRPDETFVIPAVYDELAVFHKSQSVIVEKNHKHGLMDMKGNLIISISYDELYAGKNIFLFKKDNKWGLMNNKEKVQSMFDYDEVRPGNNCFLVSLHGKWGVMTADGKLLTAIKYDRFRSGSNAMFQGFVDADMNGRRGTIDHYGNEYFPN